VHDHVYQSSIKQSYKAYKDPYYLEVVGKFSKFNNSQGYGDELFRVKLRVKPVYFDTYEGNVATDPSMKERYVAVMNTDSYYYPNLSSGVKIYVERSGKPLSKPAGYVEKEFKLMTTYQYKGKTIRTKSKQGSSLQTPFFHHEKEEDYYIKIADSGLFITSNQEIPPGRQSFTVVNELYKNDKRVFREVKQVEMDIPKFITYQFKLTGAALLPDGEKMFRNNSKWNNSGRDPLPDLIAKVKIGNYELGATAEASNTFKSTKQTNVTLNYIEGKSVDIVFYLIDKDAFLNPNDVLVKVKQDLTSFIADKPTTVTDNYLGTFSISH